MRAKIKYGEIPAPLLRFTGAFLDTTWILF
jgi:hypothetical protein